MPLSVWPGAVDTLRIPQRHVTCFRLGLLLLGRVFFSTRSPGSASLPARYPFQGGVVFGFCVRCAFSRSTDFTVFALAFHSFLPSIWVTNFHSAFPCSTLFFTLTPGLLPPSSSGYSSSSFTFFPLARGLFAFSRTSGRSGSRPTQFDCWLFSGLFYSFFFSHTRGPCYTPHPHAPALLATCTPDALSAQLLVVLCCLIGIRFYAQGPRSFRGLVFSRSPLRAARRVAFCVLPAFFHPHRSTVLHFVPVRLSARYSGPSVHLQSSSFFLPAVPPAFIVFLILGSDSSSSFFGKPTRGGSSLVISLAPLLHCAGLVSPPGTLVLPRFGLKASFLSWFASLQIRAERWHANPERLSLVSFLLQIKSPVPSAPDGAPRAHVALDRVKVH